MIFCILVFTKPKFLTTILLLLNGGIAQMGERLHGMQEVRGSIPRTSTNVVVVGGVDQEK